MWDENHGIYEKGDIVKITTANVHDKAFYYATVKHYSNMENYPSATNNIWNPTGYSMLQSDLWSNDYNILNMVGSSTLTIDTSNTKYLYLANPSTTLLDFDNSSGVFKDQNTHVYISDLAIHVEPN